MCPILAAQTLEPCLSGFAVSIRLAANNALCVIFFSFYIPEGPATGCGGGLLLLTFFAVLSFFLFWRFSCASRLYGEDVKIVLLLFLDLFVRFCVGGEHFTIIARMSIGSELPRRIGGVLTCIVSTSGKALNVGDVIA